METLSTRARKTFRYAAADGNDSSDTDSLPEQMDEEEQEALIHLLSHQDTTQTDLYSTLFTLFFLLPTFHSLFLLLTTRSFSILSLFGLSSLLLTAYSVRYLPAGPPPTTTPSLSSLNHDSGDTASEGGEGRRSLKRRFEWESLLSFPGDSDGPLGRYLPWLNGLLAGVVALGTHFATRRMTMVENEWSGGPRARAGEMGKRVSGMELLLGENWTGYIPLVVWTMGMVVRYLLKPVDLGELEKARYKYKGA